MKGRGNFLFSVPIVLVAVCGVLSCTDPTAGIPRSARDHLPQRPGHTDHSPFFQAPFPDGPSVTRACLQCHEAEAREVMATVHWNWQGQEVLVPGHEEPMRIGKRNVINNFCIGIQSNWAACTQCHIGYGWEDENFDFTDPARVDCLVCHDNSGTYRKKFRGAGLPDETVDLVAAARSVGVPRRQNCGGCHFQGGGDNAVKHGDLDNTLLFPSGRIDVHMGENDMLCIDCHQAEDHRLPGRMMTVSLDRQNRLHCSACHGQRPHADVRLNAHTARVVCQTCHIPFMAVDTGTKLSWDWSQAGQDLDITDAHLYLKIKGRFTWAKKVEPEYYWYNETATRYILGDRIDPDKPTRISAPLGERGDPTAKIWPFKVHRGKQVYDKVNRYFLVPHVHGEQGFWNRLDWPTALRLGSEVTGLPYSGLYDFAPTEMYFPLSHMVTAADQALQCRSCHGESGRLEWRALGYPSDPLGRPEVEHPPIYLMDADSDLCVDSGEPLSVAASCGICHEMDTQAFADAHGYHTSVRDALLPPERRGLMVDGPRIPQQQGSQMNCFLCHLDRPNHEARMAAVEAGLPEWSVAATLLGSGLLQYTPEGYRWSREQVSADGEIQLRLRPVRESNCGACHGRVHDGSDPLVVAPGGVGTWSTEKTGQVFSPQRVRLSGMNLAGKDALDMAWDVHAERLVSCGDCHYSRGRPQRLAGQAKPAQVEPSLGVRRRCDSCHALAETHTWLPDPPRHFRAVACESCHVPRLEMAAQQSIDQTVVRPDGTLQVSYRGVQGGDLSSVAEAYVTGYEPLLRVGVNVHGENQVLPFNLVTRWYWADGEQGVAVSAEQLARAWLQGDRYPTDIVEAFDADRNGRLEASELRLDHYAKVVLIKERLRAVGVGNPVIRGEVRAYHIHHNVRHGDYVNRSCAGCHPDHRQDLRSFDLAPYVPGGVVPVLVGDTTKIFLDGEWEVADGALRLRTTRAVDESYRVHETDRSQP